MTTDNEGWRRRASGASARDSSTSDSSGATGVSDAANGSSNGEITVVIADDQEMVRAGFRLILDSVEGIRVIGEAADGRAAIELAQRLRPDVALMDIRMPLVDGLEATRVL